MDSQPKASVEVSFVAQAIREEFPAVTVEKIALSQEYLGEWSAWITGTMKGDPLSFRYTLNIRADSTETMTKVARKGVETLQSMVPEPVYTEPTVLDVKELAKVAHITPRTIRYYVGEGILPSPVGRGPGAWYSDRHIRRLREIKELKAKGYTIKELKELYGEKSDG